MRARGIDRRRDRTELAAGGIAALERGVVGGTGLVDIELGDRSGLFALRSGQPAQLCPLPIGVGLGRGGILAGFRQRSLLLIHLRLVGADCGTCLLGAGGALGRIDLEQLRASGDALAALHANARQRSAS